MSLATLIDRPCTVIRRAEEGESFDQYGDPIVLEDEFETVCEIQQASREEPAGAGEFSRTIWDAWFPFGTPLDTSDRVEVPGFGVFEVIGDPWPAQKGSIAFVEATLIRTAAEVPS